MKKLMFVFLLLAIGMPAFAGETQLQKATNVLNEVMGTPDKGIPDELLENAVCVGIIPSQWKFAFGFGGVHCLSGWECTVEGDRNGCSGC